MALPSSGAISTDMIRTELKLPANTPIVIPDTVRKLAGKPTGSITIPNDLWGKSDVNILTLVRGLYEEDGMISEGYVKAYKTGSLTPDVWEGGEVQVLCNFTDEWLGEERTLFHLTPTNKYYQYVDFYKEDGTFLAKVYAVTAAGANPTKYEIDRGESNLSVALWNFIGKGGKLYIEGKV